MKRSNRKQTGQFMKSPSSIKSQRSSVLVEESTPKNKFNRGLTTGKSKKDDKLAQEGPHRYSPSKSLVHEESKGLHEELSTSILGKKVENVISRDKDKQLKSIPDETTVQIPISSRKEGMTIDHEDDSKSTLVVTKKQEEWKWIEDELERQKGIAEASLEQIDDYQKMIEEQNKDLKSLNELVDQLNS